MKNLLALIAIVTTLTAVTAQARSIQLPRILKADIHTFNVDAEGSLAGHKVFHGDITVNEIKRTITLFLSMGPNCMPGMMCPRYLIGRTVELPFVSAKKDNCNVVTYVARKNDMPVDGSDEKLLVRDFGTNTCAVPMYLPYVETQVEYTSAYYDRLQGQLKSEKNSFYANRLETQPSEHYRN